jgi:hypothetical protein
MKEFTTSKQLFSCMMQHIFSQMFGSWGGLDVGGCKQEVRQQASSIEDSHSKDCIGRQSSWPQGKTHTT